MSRFPAGNRAARSEPPTWGHRLKDLGLQPGQARSTALFTLATELPAALLARMLGIHIDVAVAWQRASAGDWMTYAADLSRRQMKGSQVNPQRRPPAPTQRLTFREMTADDLDDMAALLGDSDVMRYYPRPKDREEALAWIEWNQRLYRDNGFGLWLITLRAPRVRRRLRSGRHKTSKGLPTLRSATTSAPNSRAAATPPKPRPPAATTRATSSTSIG